MNGERARLVLGRTGLADLVLGQHESQGSSNRLDSVYKVKAKKNQTDFAKHQTVFVDLLQAEFWARVQRVQSEDSRHVTMKLWELLVQENCRLELE